MCYHSILTYRSSTNTLTKFEIHFVHKRPRFPAAEARELPRTERARQKPLDHGREKRSPRSTPCLQQPAAASKTRSTTTKPSSNDPPLFRISSRGERDWKPLSRCCAWQLKRKNCLTPGNNRVLARSCCCSSSSSCWYGRCSTLFHSALIAVFHQLKARQLSAGGSS